MRMESHANGSCCVEHDVRSSPSVHLAAEWAASSSLLIRTLSG